jgi:hypothetical protein
MDLSSLEFDDTVEHVIVGKDGSQTEIVFVLAGPGHPARVNVDRKIAQKALRQINRQGKASLPDDPDDLREQETDRMVELTIDWRNVTDKDGDAVPFSAEAVRAVYENRRSSVRSQISKALVDIGNFTTGLSLD